MLTTHDTGILRQLLSDCCLRRRLRQKRNADHDSVRRLHRQLLRDRRLVVRRRLTAKYFENCCFAC